MHVFIIQRTEMKEDEKDPKILMWPSQIQMTPPPPVQGR